MDYLCSDLNILIFHRIDRDLKLPRFLNYFLKTCKRIEAIEILSKSIEMPSVISNAKSLEHRFLPFAKKSNRDRITQVLEIYRSKNVNSLTTQNLVTALSSPSVLGKNGSEKVDKLFDTFISKYSEGKTYSDVRSRHVDKLKEKADRVKGIKRQFQLKIGLYAQAKLNPEPSDEQERERTVEVPMRSSSSRIRKRRSDSDLGRRLDSRSNRRESNR